MGLWGVYGVDGWTIWFVDFLKKWRVKNAQHLLRALDFEFVFYKSIGYFPGIFSGLNDVPLVIST